MQPLQKSKDLNLSFAAMARSLTNALRTGSDTESHSGKSGFIQIVLQVQWPRIILPLVVVVGGLIQVQVSVTMSRKTATPVWKSSSLAVLSRGGEVAPLLKDCKTLDEFEAKARGEHVDLFAPDQTAVQGIPMSTLQPPQYNNAAVNAAQSPSSAGGSGTALISSAIGNPPQQTASAVSKASSSVIVSSNASTSTLSSASSHVQNAQSSSLPLGSVHTPVQSPTSTSLSSSTHP